MLNTLWGISGHPWTPYNLGLDVLSNWWHADDLSAGAVVTWTDRIAKNAPTQATGGLQPINTAATINGKLAVVFDGTDDYLELAATTGISAVNSNVYVLCSQSALSSSGVTRCTFSHGATTAATARLGPQRLQTASVSRASVNINNTACSDTITTFNGVHLACAVFTTTTEAGFMNGTAFSGGTVSVANTPGTTRTDIGRNCVAGTQLWNGAIRQIIVTRGNENTLQRQQIEGYLASDGGITSLLPAGHPFINTLPTI